MNPELLSGKWQIVENPGLDTTDPRLDEIGTLVQDAAYWEAAQAAQSILEESIFDVRIIGFFFYGVFLERGIPGLALVFQSLSSVLEENWEALGPAVKKEKQAQTSLRWLTNQLLKKLQHEEGKRGDLWSQWQTQVSSEDVGECLEALEALRRQLGAVLGEAGTPVMDGLVKIGGWLEAFQRLVTREVEEEPQADFAIDEESEPTPEASSREDIAFPRGSARGATSSRLLIAESEDVVCVEGSHHLKELMHKLSVFERLVTDGKYNLAALVADDVMECLNQFDPRVYFPRLFGRFFRLMAVHIGEISNYGYDKEGVEWQVLRELYRVDPDGFADL
ncbi:MAG: hypothetical protein MUC41_01910 [Syntrophobacteraceae bacterium]|nr:hypothetical protein [Syntrophobacteraceae bacterium]